MASLRKIGPRARYAGWGLILVVVDAADAIRRRLVSSTVAVVAALALTLLIVLPGAGVGSSAVAEEIAATNLTEPEPADESAAKEKFVEVGGYSITLPDGWRTSPRPPGAAFAASSADGLATSSLWIKRNPRLGLEGFTRRCSRNLAKLGTDVEVIGQVDGETAADSSVELSALVPVGSELVAADQELASTQRVTLRVAGPYRYYLATTIQPGAPEQSFVEADELSHGLRPWLPS